jgi:hypothetical protein
MNIDKFTQKSIEAINGCERLRVTTEIRKLKRNIYFIVF